MIFYILVLLSALSISGTGAYFSILGLATMFPGSTTEVIVMGGVLEVGKIIAAIWLHLNWKSANKLMKFYLTGAVIVLMFITSMGIFGFLSKAHIEHSYLTDKEVAAAEQIDNKIARERELISRQEYYISQASKNIESSTDTSKDDIELEKKLIESIETRLKENISLEQKLIEGHNQRRKELDNALAELQAKQGGLFSSKKTKIEELKNSQSAERAGLSQKISEAEKRIQDHRDKADSDIEKSLQKITEFQKNRGAGKADVSQDIEGYNKEIGLSLERISELESEKAKFEAAAQELEAEVGPVKYVAKLFEDLGSSELPLDKAIRMVIVILIFVFDPLAVLLVLAGVSSLHSRFYKDTSENHAPNTVVETLDKKSEKRLSILEGKVKSIISMVVSNQESKKKQ